MATKPIKTAFKKGLGALNDLIHPDDARNTKNLPATIDPPASGNLPAPITPEQPPVGAFASKPVSRRNFLKGAKNAAAAVSMAGKLGKAKDLVSLLDTPDPRLSLEMPHLTNFLDNGYDQFWDEMTPVMSKYFRETSSLDELKEFNKYSDDIMKKYPDHPDDYMGADSGDGFDMDIPLHRRADSLVTFGTDSFEPEEYIKFIKYLKKNKDKFPEEYSAMMERAQEDFNSAGDILPLSRERLNALAEASLPKAEADRWITKNNKLPTVKITPEID